MLQISDIITNNKLFWTIAIIICFYAYLKLVVYSYWKRKGIPHEEPWVPFGNTLPIVLGKSSLGNLIKKNYQKFKQYRYHGIYMFYKPILMINDPELIRMILIKEFNKFRDRGLYYNEKVDPISGHLFLMPGEKWRKLRAKLSPTFTSGKLKQMFPLMKEIGDELIKTCDQMLRKDSIVESKDLIARYTIDSISSIAFGFNCNSLSDPDNDFKRYGSKAFNQNPLRNAFGAFAPSVLELFRIPLIEPEVTRFFSKTFQDMVKQRHTKNIVRKDFLNLLIQLMEKGVLEDDEKSQTPSGTMPDSNQERITMVQAQSQAFVFFVAGFETTASTITYALYELALNPEIQDKAQAEVDEFIKKGDMSYDRVLNECEYIQMVFTETLRKHPSIPFLNRVCIKDCDIPGSDFKIKKGTGIIVSITGLHSDPKIYPDPEKFDPLRFSKKNISEKSPSVYLAFGDGPRICIGSRFGILQSKIALIVLLYNYRFSVCEKTPIPVQYSKRSFTQCPEGGVHLKIEKRRG